MKQSFNNIVCGAKTKNGTRGQFECDLTWFCCCFDFVRSHGRYHLERRGWGCGRLKLDVQGQRGGRILDVDGQDGWGVLKIRMEDVICVSSLIRKTNTDLFIIAKLGNSRAEIETRLLVQSFFSVNPYNTCDFGLSVVDERGRV